MLTAFLKWIVIFGLGWLATSAYVAVGKGEIMVAAITAGAPAVHGYCIAYQPHRLVDCFVELTVDGRKKLDKVPEEPDSSI